MAAFYRKNGYKRKYSIAFDGNYCGPGWSAGEFQDSVCSTVPARSEFDMTCKEHDCSYATPGSDLKAADEKFARANFGMGAKRTAAALAVGAQGMFRPSFDGTNIVSKGTSSANSSSFLNNMSIVAKKGKPAKRTVRPGRSAKTTKKTVAKRKNGKKARKTTKRKRKNKKTSNNGANVKSGLQFTRETGGVASTTSPAMYLGHSTFPLDTGRTYIWAAVMKALFVKAGISVNAYDQSVIGDGNDVIEIEYTTVPGANTVIETSAFGSGLGLNIASMVLWFSDGARNWNDPAIISQVQFRIIRYKPYIPITGAAAYIVQHAPVELKLEGARFHYYAKSEMKMQNRTIEQDSDTVYTQLDNVPLYASVYEGKGNGARLLLSPATGSNLSFVGDTKDGVIGRYATVSNSAQGIPGDVGSYCAEPPVGAMFGCKKKKGRGLMSPGVVQTSTLTDSWSIDFNKVWQKVAIPFSDTSEPIDRLVPYGRFRFMGFDKMIETLQGSGGTRKAMIVAFEQNLYTSVRLTPGRSKMSTENYVAGVSGATV